MANDSALGRLRNAGLGGPLPPRAHGTRKSAVVPWSRASVSHRAFPSARLAPRAVAYGNQNGAVSAPVPGGGSGFCACLSQSATLNAQPVDAETHRPIFPKRCGNGAETVRNWSVFPLGTAWSAPAHSRLYQNWSKTGPVSGGGILTEGVSRWSGLVADVLLSAPHMEHDNLLGLIQHATLATSG